MPRAENIITMIRRNERVVLLRVQRKTWPEIAAETGISERMCRKIYKEWNEERRFDLEALDPIEYVVDKVNILENQQTDLGVMALRAKTNEETGLAVQALKGQREAMATETELLQATGFLPRDLGRLHMEISTRHVVSVIMEVFDRYAVPKEAKDEILAAVNGAHKQLPPGLVPAPVTVEQ